MTRRRWLTVFSPEQLGFFVCDIAYELQEAGPWARMPINDSDSDVLADLIGRSVDHTFERMPPERTWRVRVPTSDDGPELELELVGGPEDHPRIQRFVERLKRNRLIDGYTFGRPRGRP